ncbi:MAG TPA: alpha/beta hydrolase [Jatrophihabitantaceae bacterium]|nr:alpha/beta hydrolase [Jatrophihabitantaceae bacterium]
MTAYGQNQLPHYDRRPGTGPSLVFLHYWGGSGRTWAPVISALPGRDVLTVDFRGWGRSRNLPGPYHLHQLAADTRAVLDADDVSDFVLVGHSMGGKVAQLVAADQPHGLRGIVLVAPAPARPADSIDAQYQEGLSHAYDSADTVAGARDAVLTATGLSAALQAQVVEDSLASDPDARGEWPLRGIAEDVSAETKRITVHTLVVAGERDQVEPAAVLRANLIPYLGDAELTVIPASGHLIPLEAPEALAALISGFPPGSRKTDRRPQRLTA